MRQLNKESFSQLIKQSGIKTRLARELRFRPDTVSNWTEKELMPVYTKDTNIGILLLSPDEDIYIIPFTISRGISDKTTGRTKAVICDFCYTYQQSGNAARITFTSFNSLKSTSYLCCADLNCSDHVRNLTSASTRSRAQLHEDLTVAQRVERLKYKIRRLIEKHGMNV